MRIIGGGARGRKLFTPRDRQIRPTSDKVKEAIFNILSGLLGGFEGLTVLDVFSGTGNLGIEALSRGGELAVFIDNSREATQLVSRNLAQTGFVTSSRIVAKEAMVALGILENSGSLFDLVFLDPPYNFGLAERVLSYLATSRIIGPDSIIVAEFSSREDLPSVYDRLHEFNRRVYGDTAVSFLRLDTAG